MGHLESIGRICRILSLLPSSRGHRGMTAAALLFRLRQEGFDVCKRTIDRDLQQMQKLFPIERVALDGQSQLWKRSRDLDLEIFMRPIVREEEALDLTDPEDGSTDAFLEAGLPSWPGEAGIVFMRTKGSPND